jgi:very-short-patch-repair endonuclease
MKKKILYATSPLLLERVRKNMSQLILWEYLRIKPFGYKFKRHCPVGIYTADFFCSRLNLVIEIGDSACSDEIKKNNELFTTRKIQVIRLGNHEMIETPEQAIAKIERVLHEVSSGSENQPARLYYSFSTAFSKPENTA